MCCSFSRSYDGDMPLRKFFSSFYHRYNPSKNRDDIEMAVFHWKGDEHLEQLFVELSKKYDIENGQLKREYEAHQLSCKKRGVLGEGPGQESRQETLQQALQQAADTQLEKAGNSDRAREMKERAHKEDVGWEMNGGSEDAAIGNTREGGGDEAANTTHSATHTPLTSAMLKRSGAVMGLV